MSDVEVTIENIDEMELFEAFDTREELRWQTNGDFELTSFVQNDVKYVIQIQKHSFIPNMGNIKEFRGAKIGEVSFFVHKAENSEKAYSTNTSSKPTGSIKTYSTVLHGVSEKFDNYDVYFFDVMKRHSKDNSEFTKKKAIYQSMISHMKVDHVFRYYESNMPDKTLYVVSKIKLSEESEERSGLVHPLKEAMRMVGLETDQFPL